MRILYLTHRLPYAANRGDRLRAFHTLRTLAAEFEVRLVSLVHDDLEASHRDDLLGQAASVRVARVSRLRNIARAGVRLGTRTPLTHLLLDSPEIFPLLEDEIRGSTPDLVLAYCSSMARFAMEGPLAGIPFILDMVDVDSAKWQALCRHAVWPMSWVYRREAELLSGFEAEAARSAEATFVVTEREAETLRSLSPGVPVEVLPNGIDADYFAPVEPPAASHDVVFCGVMDYGPNEQAAAWLAREVWPAVVGRIPTARLFLVGANPTRRVLALAALHPSITVTGSVPDVRPFLWRAAVAVAPLQVARGIQNKVLEAVASGLPTVVTSVVASGLPREVSPAVEVADSPTAFADLVVRLLALSPAERRSIARSADLGKLTWAGALGPLVAKIRSLGARPR